MKAQVTFIIDTDLLREARVLAAEEGRSLGAIVCDLLAGLVRDRQAFHKARRRALERLRHGFDLQWKRSDRGLVHER